MRVRLFVAGIVALTLFAASAPESMAVTGIATPLWPADGRVPQCDGAYLTSFGPNGYQLTYSDASVPHVVSINAPTVVVIGPRSSGFLRVRVRVDDLCSGVGLARIIVSAIGLYSQQTLTQTSPDAFQANFELDLGAITPATGPVAIRFQDVLAWDRYESFVLDQNARLVSTVPRADPSTTPAGTYSGPAVTTFVVAQTTVGMTTSASTVRRGAVVQVRGQVTAWSGMSSPPSFMPHGFAPVALQVRTTSGAWRTVATQTSDGFGGFSFRARVKVRTSFRVVFAPALATLYAASTSPVRTVGVR